MTLKQQAINDLITKFPKASSHALAKLAYLENKELFADAENARNSVRSMRGTFGKYHRANIKIKAHFSELSLALLAKGLTQTVRWAPLLIPGPIRALILSDIHVPYHDKPALRLAVAHGKQHKANLILLNGDTLDGFAISKWEKDPRKRDFPNEIAVTKHLVAAIRLEFPKARIIYKLGNHDERWISYMRSKAPELLGLPELDFENLLGLTANSVELVADKRPIRLGDLNVVHGHEYRFAISNPVNAARGLFLRAKAYALCGHFHQASSHSEKTVEGNVIATWSTGCLCEMHPEYAPLNNWVHGFAFVEVMANGKFNVQNKVIRHGKIY